MNKTLFITGAGSGIGQAVTRLALARGDRVIAADINLTAWDSVSHPGLLLQPLDIRDVDQWQTALEKAKAWASQIDVVINNAAIHHIGWVHDLTEQQIRDLVDVNLLGTLWGSRAALALFSEQQCGHLITVDSLIGFTTMPGQVVYSATKHAVRALHHGLALEWRDTPMQFSIIHPPAVETPMLEKQIRHDEAALSFAAETTSAEEVARQILKAMDKQPREIVMGGITGQATKLLGLLPGLQQRILKRVEQQGRKNLQKRRQ